MSHGRIIASFGRHYTVQDQTDGQQWLCYARGKKNLACVGDWVSFSPESKTEGVINEILERKNLFYRSDEIRSKQFAANIDLILMVVATEPDFSLELIARAYTASQAEQIPLIILLNKADIQEKLPEAIHKLQLFNQTDIQVLPISALDISHTKSQLQTILHQKTSLLLGQSGMGKSTILNSLVPEAQAWTQEFSQALGAGKHTTTSSRLYPLPFDTQSFIIDSPGFQSFGLQHLNKDQLLLGFPEFSDVQGRCKFNNCTHRHEPNCVITQALAEQHIQKERYEFYCKLIGEYEKQLQRY